MKRTYKIQRLIAPRMMPVGIGGSGGPLPAEAQKTLADVFAFDYMGASEFEWGAVPKVLTRIGEYCETGDVVGGTIVLPPDVHYICRAQDQSCVEERIRELYDQGDSFRLIEPAHFRESVDELELYAHVQGWLEMDNAFMFFKNHEMYQKARALSGLE